MGFLHDISHSWTKNLDQRVVDLPLVASSYQVPLIIFAYLYFVFICGPRFMKNRPPYSLKTFIKVYNVVQILGNAWLIYDHIDGVLSSKLVCPVLDYTHDYNSIRFIRCVWYFFLFKILDYVETGVFILRKKNNQVSALHLYHHVSTLIFTWLAIRYYAVAPMVFLALINSFIHTIMYTYYFLAACGPNIQKAIAPMKPWITISQMIQFVVLLLYVSQQHILGCKVVNNWAIITFGINIIINFFMFHNFYQKTYKKLKKTQ